MDVNPPARNSLGGILAVSGALLLALGLEDRSRRSEPESRSWEPRLSPNATRDGFTLEWIEAGS